MLIIETLFFFGFEPHEQFFSYLAIVTINSDWAANLNICLALTACSSEGFFYVPHLLRYGTSVFKVISERHMIITSECRALDGGAIATYFKRLWFDAAGPSGAQNSRFVTESTTTRLRQPVQIKKRRNIALKLKNRSVKLK
jgi:hypothetical protein